MTGGYTFVTVCHDIDVPLLRLQARSFARYALGLNIDRIVVIGNPDLTVLPVQSLLQEYGPLSLKVIFASGSTLTNLTNVSGWWSQQLLKLLIAYHLPRGTDRYTVLDAKHHLVFPLYSEQLIKDGLPRLRCYGYRMEHPLRPKLAAQLEYFGLGAQHLDLFIQTTPPFTFWTWLVKRLIQQIEDREEMIFSQAFLLRQLTEFFSYGCSIIANGEHWDDHYSPTQPLSPMIWKHGADVWGVLQQIAESEEPQRPFFAVHRGAIKVFEPAARDALAQFWCRRHLFPSVAEARQYLQEAADGIPG